MNFLEQVGGWGIALAILGLVLGCGLGAAAMWVRMRLAQNRQLQDARRQSVAQSRSTLKGQIGEQLAPLLPGFHYAPSDARFLGDPIDYVVFHGYTAVKDDGASGAELEVVILDIKRGGARLSGAQRAVAEAVAAGRVRFEVVRIDDDGRVERQEYGPRRG
ncbi:MAG: Holliday junction resolvase-like protein [Tepidisphaerales bacterium]